MEDKRADISQVQQYLKGKLDSKAMHRLEREAQANPFLADAMEGYAGAADQEGKLAALQQRLQQRVETKVRRLMPWTTIAIAASVIGFVIVAGLFFMRDSDTNKAALQVAANEAAKPAPSPLIEAPATTVKDKAKAPAPAATLKEAPKPMANLQQSAKTPRSIIANKNTEQYVAETNTPQTDDILKKVPETDSTNLIVGYYSMAKRRDTVLGGEHIAINKKPSEVTLLKAKADGASYKERERQSAGATAALLASNLSPTLTGKVLDRNNGLPLPGASVKVVGQPTETRTDANGLFALPNVKPDDKVSYGYIGYNSKILPAKPGDSVKVSLDANSNSLSEVVVTQAYKRTGPKAAPIPGWKAYNKYLKQQASLSAGEKTGSVEVSFTVNTDGTISDIKVAKSLSPEADLKAMNIINNGPGWFGNLNGKPEVVKVTVKFSNKN